MECKSLRESDSAISAFNAKLFMASADDIETNTEFAKKNEASFPVLSDKSKKVAEAYGVKSLIGLPKRWTFYIGTDGEILKIDKQVKPLSAGKDITETLTALNVGKR